MQSLHSGSSACLKSKAETLDAKFAFWVFCLPKIQGPNLGCKVCILGLLPAWKFNPKPWMQSLHSGSSACLKFKAQTLDAMFAFWVFCLPKVQAQTLDGKFAFWVFCLPKNPRPKPWMQSLHSGSSACLKIQPQALDAKFAFWVFCLPKIQGPNLGCKVCILGLLPAWKFNPKPWMQSLHSGSSACLKFKAQTLDAKFAFWVFCLPKIQGPNLGCKVCILGLLPAKNSRPKPWMQSLHSGSSACLKI